jgi:hypothetical protein
VLTDVENDGCGERWQHKGHEGYLGSSLRKDNNHTSYVRWCIMICWVETLSTPPFIYQEDRVYKERVSYNLIRSGLYLYLPNV